MIWYVAENGLQKKMPEEVLVYKIENGEILPETLVIAQETVSVIICYISLLIS